MIILEAYEIGMAKVAELKGSGIEVRENPTGDRPHNQNSKYLLSDRLPLDKYLHISFIPKTEDDWDSIFEAEDVLVNQGISFDTGAGGEQRDWEFDWSFEGPETEYIEMDLEEDARDSEDSNPESPFLETSDGFKLNPNGFKINPN